MKQFPKKSLLTFQASRSWWAYFTALVLFIRMLCIGIPLLDGRCALGGPARGFAALEDPFIPVALLLF